MTPAQRRIKRWREEPAWYVHNELKVENIDPWQKEALDVFPSQDPDKIRIALQACVGPGKTAVLAWCGWNFLSCYGERGEHPKGAAVSVTAQNLADNLWPEYSKWQSRSEFLLRAFTWTKTRIYANDHPETWFMAARSFSKTANPEEQGRTLSGLHSKYVLAQIDESGDIPPPVLKAAEQALSNCKFGKIMQAGNPTSHHGILYAAATTLRDQWYLIRITGDPDDRKRSTRIDIDWARDQIRLYGREDPWVMATILSQFPKASINALLSVEEVEASMARKLREDAYSFSQRRLGVDVARFGDDRTILFPRQGLQAFKPLEMRNARNDAIAARIAQAKLAWPYEIEFVDDTGGYGAGVIDMRLQAGESPMGVNFASQATNPRYFNKRSEMIFSVAEWIKRGGALPYDSQLIKELTTPTYTFHQGKLRVEEKDQIKRRLKFSPDKADALGLTFALPEMPASDTLEGRKQAHGQVATEYDPYADERL
jgi:phage terminase large subunit